MKIYYRLIIRETKETRLRIAEVNQDKEYLDEKAKKLETEEKPEQESSAPHVERQPAAQSARDARLGDQSDRGTIRLR